MKRFAKALAPILVIGLLIGAIAFVIWAIASYFSYISTAPKEIASTLVAGTVTILVATLTVTIGRYFERKRELDALYRDKKIEIYDAFLKKFFEMTGSDSHTSISDPDPNLVAFLREFTRTLILWSGPNVINAFLAWKDHLAKGTPDAKTIFLTENLLTAIRSDLRHSNSGLTKGFFARIYLRESALFLAASANNPNITLAEISALEKSLSKATDSD